MPLESIRLSSRLPAAAARVYAAWLDGAEHTRMTGGTALVDGRVGGRHYAWAGYIEGEILELEADARIVLSWRTSEFPLGHPHSRLEIRLHDVPGGCEVILVHTEIPEGQGEKYEAGWQDHYFNPMTKYFREYAETIKDLPKKPAKTRTAKKKVVAKPKKVAKSAKSAKTAKSRSVAKKIAKAKKAAPKRAPKKIAKAKKVAKPKKAKRAK